MRESHQGIVDTMNLLLGAGWSPEATKSTKRNMDKLLLVAITTWALTQTQGKVGEAAKLLGVPERTFRRDMRSSGVDKSTFKKRGR